MRENCFSSLQGRKQKNNTKQTKTTKNDRFGVDQTKMVTIKPKTQADPSGGSARVIKNATSQSRVQSY